MALGDYRLFAHLRFAGDPAVFLTLRIMVSPLVWGAAVLLGGIAFAREVGGRPARGWFVAVLPVLGTFLFVAGPRFLAAQGARRGWVGVWSVAVIIYFVAALLPVAAEQRGGQGGAGSLGELRG